MPSQSQARTPTPQKSESSSSGPARSLQPRGNAAAQERLTQKTSPPKRAPLPFRDQLEKSFGVDLSTVEAVFGGGGQGQATAGSGDAPNLAAGEGAQLPARALTDKKTIWFREENPAFETVAHEVTHIVQQRQGPGGTGLSQKGDASEQEAKQAAKAAAAGEQVQVEQAAGAAVHGDWLDSLGDAFGLRENEEALDLQEDIDDFKSENYGPITYTRPNISGSGFEASYYPNSDRLYAEVRAKVRFADGLTANGGAVTSPNSFMNNGQLDEILTTYPALQAQVLPYYQWGADEKEIYKQRFFANISSVMGTWENTGLSLQVNETGWEGVVARPDIEIKISEGEAVSASQDYGPFGIFSAFDEQASDHLQIEIVKQISVADAATVNGLIATYLTANAPGVAAPAAGDARGVRSYLGTDPGARNGNPGSHNNFMSLESDRSDNSAGQTYDHTVNFENKETTINASEQARLDTFLADPMVLLQNPNGAVNISLHGYASAPGSTASNEQLVSQRLSSVSSALNSKMDSSTLNIHSHVDPATQANDADHSAEADLMAPAAKYRRVDIHIEQTGRGGQNVMAHEFGHVLGLGDEYAETANGYNRPAGAAADHDQLARDAGVATGATVGDDARIMSTGNNVGAAHYSTFADALKQLTDKSWKVV